MDFASRLRNLRIQSATTIAIESLKHLLAYTKKNGFGRKFDAECDRLLKARPTAVVLYNAIEKLRKSRNAETLSSIISGLDSSKSMAAKHSSSLFRRKKTVLTHCHSSFVVAALVKNKARIKGVIVTETRPKDQGLITARELLKNKIKVSYIVDSAISDFIGRADIVLVGADALRREGLVNKVGTHPLALVAKENRKPFYVVTSSFTIDKRKKIIMEQRPDSEIMHRHIKGARIYNPAFDITPWKYVTGIVTENGILKPKEILK